MDMEVFEKAKLALRDHLLKNKERVVADLEEMRRQSEGSDIFNYIEYVANSFSFENVTSIKEFPENYTFEQDIMKYIITGISAVDSTFLPPGKNDKNIKKDSEVFAESFFLI